MRSPARHHAQPCDRVFMILPCCVLPLVDACWRLLRWSSCLRGRDLVPGCDRADRDGCWRVWLLRLPPFVRHLPPAPAWPPVHSPLARVTVVQQSRSARSAAAALLLLIARPSLSHPRRSLRSCRASSELSSNRSPRCVACSRVSGQSRIVPIRESRSIGWSRIRAPAQQSDESS